MLVRSVTAFICGVKNSMSDLQSPCYDIIYWGASASKHQIGRMKLTSLDGSSRRDNLGRCLGDSVRRLEDGGCNCGDPDDVSLFDRRNIIFDRQ